jgi:5'-3' exonuclease
VKKVRASDVRIAGDGVAPKADEILERQASRRFRKQVEDG